MSVPDVTRSSLRARIAALLQNNTAAIMVELGLVLVLVYLVERQDLLPSSAPLLVLLGWLSLWLRRIGWREVGLRPPDRWWRCIALGLGGGLVLSLLIDVLGDPWLARLTGEPVDLSAFGELRGNLPAALFTLALSWVLGALGEELAYRGYLLNRLADLGRRRPGAWLVALILTSVLFGLIHAGQGRAGILSSGLSGLGYGVVYLLAGRNLWAAIIAHGVANTLTLWLIYSGVYTGR